MQPLVGDTVLTWDSVAGWPTVGDFPIRIDHPSNGTFEYVLCTSVNVGALQTTVTRAQESTSASGGFIVGSTGANALTKATMDAAFARLDTALSQTLTGPLVIPTALGGSAAATSYGSVPLKAFESLLVGTAASISFSSIPATFRHLYFDWYAKSDSAALNTQVWMRFNNDAAANYDTQNNTWQNATVAVSEQLAQAQMVVGVMTAATATAAFFGVGESKIHHYAGTTGNKVVTSQGFWGESNATSSQRGFDQRCKWRTTATAINRVDLIPQAGNFIIGSLFTAWLEP